MALTFEHVTKRFGAITVVNDVSLTIPAGSLHGVVGPNGTGKTTLFRLILGLVTPDAGRITWNGSTIRRDHPRIAYVPEERGLYPHMTVEAHLRWFGQLNGLSKADARHRAVALLDQFTLTPYRRHTASQLSKGNARKLQWAIAWVIVPALLILDEPFDGMDPVNVRLVRDLLRDAQDHGITVLVSSHQLAVLDGLCTHFTLLHPGAAPLHGDRAALTQRMAWQRLTIRFRTPDAGTRLAAWHPAVPVVLESAPDAWTRQYRVARQDVDRLPLQEIWQLGSCAAVSLDPPSLTDIYWDVVTPAPPPLEALS